MLFLDTLHVSAASSVWDLIDSHDYVDTSAVSYTLNYEIVGDLTALSLGSGTYTGSSSGSYSGTSSGTYSGEDIPISYYSYAPLSGTSATGSYQGSYTGSVSSSGSESGGESGTISVNVYGTVVEGHVDYDSSGDVSTSDSGSLSSTSSGTISFSSTSSGDVCTHVKIPVDMHYIRYGNQTIDPSSYYAFSVYANSITANGGSGTLKNFTVTDSVGNILYIQGGARAPKFDVGSNFLYATSNKFGIYGYIEFDYVLWNYSGSDFVNVTFNLNPFLRLVKEEYQATVGSSVVSDTVAHEIQQSTLESSQAIEESVTSDTGTGLLATIKNFFGSFFSNIINSFISLFVPSSDYFSTWFENLNDLLSDKLGMLYSPFDFIISILNSVYSADTSEPSIPFPAIIWDGTTLVSAQNLKFSEILGDNYSTLQGYVYFGTDTVLLFAFLYLLQRKIALILTGSEANG